MSVRDTLVQIAFLMVAAGAMIAVWALVAANLRRPPPDEPDDEA